jgi:hypothetical protein
MDALILLLALSMDASPASQTPRRIAPDRPGITKPVYREVQAGEQRVEGLLLRVDCPRGRPIVFAVKVKDRVTMYQAPRLDAVEYIAHTPDFKGGMTCGGRMPGDPVFLTWKPVGTSQRAVAVEFLPRKQPAP